MDHFCGSQEGQEDSPRLEVATLPSSICTHSPYPCAHLPLTRSSRTKISGLRILALGHTSKSPYTPEGEGFTVPTESSRRGCKLIPDSIFVKNCICTNLGYLSFHCNISTTLKLKILIWQYVVSNINLPV